MQPRNIAAIIIGLIAAGLVIGSRMQSKGDTGDKMKAEALAIISHVKGFEKDRAYYTSLLDGAHERAFEENYHISYGKRTRGTFDPNVYIEQVFKLMIDRANSDGSTHIAANLDKYYKAEVLGEDPPDTKAPAHPKK